MYHRSHDENRALPEIPAGDAGYNSSIGKTFHAYDMVQGEQDSQTYAAVSGNSDFDPDYAGTRTCTTSIVLM